jgi:kynureninase
MTELDFPSVRYVYDQLATRLGARIVVVPSDDGITIDTQRVLDAIDERTKLVAISHVLFRSAFIMNAAAICRRAHEVGALVSLDAFHSVGVMPVDVKALGVDFLSGGVLKWLCGGPDATASLSPSFTGWQAHEHPFAFDGEMHYASGAWRWLNGTPAVPALFAAIEGPRLLRRAGIENVRAKSVRQTSRLIELADARGYAVTVPRNPDQRGGTVAFDVPHAYGVAQALLANNIIVDYRPNAGVRVAPHFYTSDDELERAVDMIDGILRDEDWKKFEDKRGVVT